MSPQDLKNKTKRQKWRDKSLVPAIQRQKQDELCELEARVVCK